MKNFALVLFFAVAMAFPKDPADWRYYSSSCTTVQDIDYCADNPKVLNFLFSDSLIVVRHYWDHILDLKVKSPWRYNDSTGEWSLKVWTEGGLWTLTEKKTSFVLKNHRCSTIEFWQGSRKSLHGDHGYVSVDMDDLLKFTDVCKRQKKRRSRTLRKKKFDSGRLIMGALPTDFFDNLN